MQWLLDPTINIHSPLRVQLALSVAALAIQDDSWESPVLDVLNQFNRKEHILVLLEIWMVFPEEFTDNHHIELSVLTFNTIFNQK